MRSLRFTSLYSLNLSYKTFIRRNFHKKCNNLQISSNSVLTILRYQNFGWSEFASLVKWSNRYKIYRTRCYSQNNANRITLRLLVLPQFEIKVLDIVSSLCFASLFFLQNLEFKTAGTRNYLQNAADCICWAMLVCLYFNIKVLDKVSSLRYGSLRSDNLECRYILEQTNTVKMQQTAYR